MVTCIPHAEEDCKCATVCRFALDMMQQLQEYNCLHPDRSLDLRVGMNTGPVVAGVVGTKRFLYDIWGDAVNLASRMESTGVPGRIQVTASVVNLVSPQEFSFESRGVVAVKGKGPVETYFLNTRLQDRERHFSNEPKTE